MVLGSSPGGPTRFYSGVPRETSIAAYNALVGSGKLKGLQEQAYEALYRLGPLTGRELGRDTGIEGVWKSLR